MIPRLFLLLLCLLLPLGAGAAEFRVVTWNIEWFPGHKPKSTPEEKAAHIAAVQNALAEIDPDILFLQEVPDWKAAEAAVAKVPGLRLEMTSNFPGTQELAIATKFPVNSGWTAQWEKRGVDDPPRAFAGKRVAVCKANAKFIS